MSYDDSQQKIIDNTEGFVLADAGPGTGKTHTVTGRCLAILKSALKQGRTDIAMLTFTRNAATEMQERLIREAAEQRDKGLLDKDREYPAIVRMIRTMFIGTFDSFCLNVVKKAPWVVSDFFKFNSVLSSSANITENETLNKVYFRRFISQWLEDNASNGGYGEYPAIASQHPDDLYSIINRLMCMGLMPLRSGGWFGGNPRARRDEVGPANEPVELRGNPEKVYENALAFWSDGDNKKKKFEKDDFDSCYDSMFVDGVIPADLAVGFTEEQYRAAAYDDRSLLIDMIHDIYYSYMGRCVSNDHLTFGLVACFAYIALYKDADVREQMSFDYLIVDEFQDTNALQMMISMMVLRRPNLCVVGDWRQGIYGFRYVSVENILKFHDRLVKLSKFLNDDGIERVRYAIPSKEKVHELPLAISYRSSQKVIHAAYYALTIPGSEKDKVDAKEAEEILAGEIKSYRDPVLKDYTYIHKVECPSKEEEADEVVRRIIDFVMDATPKVFDKGCDIPRRARFKDVAVLCRGTKGCRLVYEALRKYNVPAFLQGDMEVMNTPEGKILLAWMKFVENRYDNRGIVPILAYLGFSAAEIMAVVKNRDLIPEEIERLRNVLKRKTRRITDFVSTVYSFHGIGNDISQAVSDVLSSAHNSSLMTISELISMMEEDIESATRYNVDGRPERDAVVIQTMHKSKGLEYPLVIMPYMDSNTFPNNRGDTSVFTFDETAGIRCSEIQVTMADGSVELDGSWKSRIVSKTAPKDYSEEKRLFFVAISRAKQYVVMIAGKNGSHVSPSAFFKNSIGDDVPPLAGEIEVLEDTSAAALAVPDMSYERRSRPSTMNVHDVMGVSNTESLSDMEGNGRGMGYGTRVHRLAQMIVNGSEVDEETAKAIEETRFIQHVVKNLPEGARYTETQCALHREVDGRNVTVNGNIDLLVVTGGDILVYDWKTDVKQAHREDYMLQLSIYAACVRDEFPGRNVRTAIVWLYEGFRQVDEFEPMTDEMIVDRIRELL